MRYREVVFSLALLSAVAAPSEPVTVYLAGDSTAAEKRPDKRPETGWGEALQQFFRPDEVRVANRAMNGRSTRTFIEEGRWQAIVDSLKAGDYVFIQFGHNDASKDRTDRYTPPEDYRRNLVRFATEVRAKKATPVLLTPVRRRKFDADGRLVDTHGEYPDIVRAVASAQRVPLIDMHRKTARLLTRYGADSSRKLFLQLKPGENPNYPNGVEDNTHFRPLGAELVAGLVVDGIVEQKLGLAAHLHEAPRRVAPAGAAPLGGRAARTSGT